MQMWRSYFSSSECLVSSTFLLKAKWRSIQKFGNKQRLQKKVANFHIYGVNSNKLIIF